MNTLETLQIKLLTVKTSQKNHEYHLMTCIFMAFPHEIPDHSCISSNNKVCLGNIA